MRALAFHLPQFHPIPENDEWWGKGFTEWTNVVPTQPRFRGHYQPHLPADLGFYDLRLAESRIAQAELARAHGIHGFCYYHYWFNGRRLLERPVDEILASHQPDFPFCLCWANENWSRRWDGLDQEILLGQNYSAEDDVAHLRSLLPYFKDQRYIKVDGKPLFLIYRLGNLPEPDATLRCWRDEAVRAGLPGLYLCAVECTPPEHGHAAQYALDAAVEFAPDWTQLNHRVYRWRRRPPWFRNRPESSAFLTNHVFNYRDLMQAMLAKPTPPYLRYPCVTPMWDNSARRKEGAIVIDGSTPALYEEWLSTVVSRACPRSADEDFIFINAWNEWAEGSHLEPCQLWGRQYLEATRRALQSDGSVRA